jgi:uncharacterized protein
MVPMETSWRVMDADGHINEDPADIGSFLGAPYGGKNHFFPAWPSLDGRFRSPDVTATDVTMWTGFLESAGVDEAVIYPTMGLAHGLIQDAGWAVTLAAAYNDWIYARYTGRDPRMHAVALLSPQDVDGSVNELRRAVKDLRCVAGLMPAVTYDNAVFGKEKYWPIYEEAVRLNRPIVFHGAPQLGLGLECFDSHIEAHVLEHALPQFKQMVSVIYQGVFDTFPKLRVGFLEAGAGWLPYLADRMDYEYGARPGKAKIHRRPSDYLEGENVYVACEPEEPGLAYTVQRFGSERILYPTDFPHELAFDQYLEDLDEFKEREDLPADARRQILWDNPRRFYGLN